MDQVKLCTTFPTIRLSGIVALAFIIALVPVALDGRSKALRLQFK